MKSRDHGVFTAGDACKLATSAQRNKHFDLLPYPTRWECLCTVHCDLLPYSRHLGKSVSFERRSGGGGGAPPVLGGFLDVLLPQLDLALLGQQGAVDVVRGDGHHLPKGGHLHGQVVAQALEGLPPRHKVRLAVHLHQHAQPGIQHSVLKSFARGTEACKQSRQSR